VLEQAIEIDRRMPVVVLTRCLDMKCYVDAMHLGALDYLEGPQASVEIARLIETHSRPHGAAASV
jgi:FixJ family two-component response regulator